jgi:hypothetical protein
VRIALAKSEWVDLEVWGVASRLVFVECPAAMRGIFVVRRCGLKKQKVDIVIPRRIGA